MARHNLTAGLNFDTKHFDRKLIFIFAVIMEFGKSLGQNMKLFSIMKGAYKNLRKIGGEKKERILHLAKNLKKKMSYAESMGALEIHCFHVKMSEVCLC